MTEGNPSLHAEIALCVSRCRSFHLLLVSNAIHNVLVAVGLPSTETATNEAPIVAKPSAPTKGPKARKAFVQIAVRTLFTFLNYQGGGAIWYSVIR